MVTRIFCESHATLDDLAAVEVTVQEFEAEIRRRLGPGVAEKNRS